MRNKHTNIQLTSVAVSVDVKAEMDKIGQYRESYNDIIRRLLLTVDMLKKSLDDNEEEIRRLEKVIEENQGYCII